MIQHCLLEYYMTFHVSASAKYTPSVRHLDMQLHLKDEVQYMAVT